MSNRARPSQPPDTSVRLVDVSIAPSSDLPRWFGAVDRPAVRIAGKVRGAATALTVRLAINVPDPGIWAGREVVVAPDGSFDFGPMRAGSYLLVAFGQDPMSRITAVDTTIQRGDQLELATVACHLVTGTFWTTSDRDSRDPRPAASVNVTLSGWVLGITSVLGAYSVCVPDGSNEARLRVPGYADPSDIYRIDADGHRLLWPQHLDPGFVLDADGAPMANVGVQPIWYSNDSIRACRASSVVMTTDGAGRFTYNGEPRLCGFRILRGTTTHDELFDGMKFNDPQIVQLPAAGQERQLFD